MKKMIYVLLLLFCGCIFDNPVDRPISVDLKPKIDRKGSLARGDTFMVFIDVNVKGEVTALKFEVEYAGNCLWWLDFVDGVFDSATVKTTHMTATKCGLDISARQDKDVIGNGIWRCINLIFLADGMIGPVTSEPQHRHTKIKLLNGIAYRGKESITVRCEDLSISLGY